MHAFATDLELLEHAAKEAGEIAMRYFRAENRVWTKSGDSPVSEADYAVDRHLHEVLRAARPEYGWLSEETDDNEDRLSCETLFVVDPIDGTRGFIEGSTQWCISLAVVHDGRPVAGVLAAPAAGQVFMALSGEGASLNGERLSLLGSGDLRSFTASRRLNRLVSEKCNSHISVVPFVPSLAYRLAMVARGEVDAAIARPGAHDWDLAAAELVLEGAGGLLTGLDGERRRYNLPHPRSGSLIACAAGRHDQLLKLAKSSGFLQ